ncbi:MAG TPA: hypothetical protein VGK04_09720 [Thermoanaerobaculia bacterium]
MRRIHRKDLAAELGEVWLPNALERKYVNGGREFAWQVRLSGIAAGL